MEKRKTSSPSRRKGRWSQIPFVRRRRKLWRSVKPSKSVKKRYTIVRIRKRRTKQLKYRYVRKRLYYKYPSQLPHRPVPEPPAVPQSVLPVPDALRGQPAVSVPVPPPFIPTGTGSPERSDVAVAVETAQVLPEVMPAITPEAGASSEDIQGNQATAATENISEQSVADNPIRNAVIEADVVPDVVFINLLATSKDSDLQLNPEINRAEDDESVGTIVNDETIALMAQQVQGSTDNGV